MNGDGLDLGKGVSLSVLHVFPLAHCRGGAWGPREPPAPVELLLSLAGKFSFLLPPSLLSLYTL